MLDLFESIFEAPSVFFQRKRRNPHPCRNTFQYHSFISMAFPSWVGLGCYRGIKWKLFYFQPPNILVILNTGLQAVTKHKIFQNFWFCKKNIPKFLIICVITKVLQKLRTVLDLLEVSLLKKGYRGPSSLPNNFFESTTTHMFTMQSELTQWKNSASLCLFCVLCGQWYGQWPRCHLTAINHHPFPSTTLCRVSRC